MKPTLKKQLTFTTNLLARLLPATNNIEDLKTI